MKNAAATSEAEMKPYTEVIENAEVTFDILAVMSEVKLIVPPGIRVECDGMALLGEFSDRHDASGGDAEAPIVRVRGTSVMANVRVETRLPGETKLEIGRRRAKERLTQELGGELHAARAVHGRDRREVVRVHAADRCGVARAPTRP